MTRLTTIDLKIDLRHRVREARHDSPQASPDQLARAVMATLGPDEIRDALDQLMPFVVREVLSHQ